MASRLIALWLLLLAFVAAAMFFGDARADARAAHLDRGFGQDGVRYLPRSIGEVTGAVLFGDGRVFVSGEVIGAVRLAALKASGRLDRDFGDRGFAHLAAPPGDRADPFAISVDPQGRPVVVGQAGRGPVFSLTPPAEDETPLVERLTAGGIPDQSFGEGRGSVVDDFGLPLPPEEGRPDAYAFGVAYDTDGRMVVFGENRIGSSGGKYGPMARRGVFVARLDRSGAQDTSFGSAGLLQLPTIGRIDSFSVASDNSVTLSVRGRRLIRYLGDGTLDSSFDESGTQRLPDGVSGANLLVDGQDRLVSYGRLPGTGRPRTGHLLVTRLFSDGSPDRSFGTKGKTTISLPRFYSASLRIDDRDRILVAVSIRPPRRGDPNGRFEILRLRSDGRLDRSFGRQGILQIPISGSPLVSLEGLDVRGEEAVIRFSDCRRSGPCRSALALVDLGGSAGL